ncbi:MAG: glycosyl hydrolase family 18 protein [Anaerolineae bacterium]
MDDQTPLRGLQPYDEDPNDTHDAGADAEPSPDDTRASAPLTDEPRDPLDWEAITPSSGVTPVSGMPTLDDIDFVAPSPPASQPSPEHPYRGRARERIAKRKGGQPSGAPPRQTTPRSAAVRNAPPRERVVRDPSSVVTRGITSARSAARTAVRGAARGASGALPEASFKLPISRTGLYLIGSVVFVFAIVIILGAARNRPVEALPNALFIGTEWTYEDQTEESVYALAERLKQNQIGIVYAWVSWLQADNTWRGQDNFEKVREFVRLFKLQYPEADLYGWVSFPVEPNGTYRMNDAVVQQTVADFSKHVIEEFGFDGVFLNAEPVWNGDENFLSLLRTVRRTVGDNVLISAAVPPDWSPIGTGIPVPALIVPGTVWESDYKQNVALLVDQLVVMGYNSGLTTATDYTQWMAYQVATYAETIDALSAGTQVLIGIPTYDAEPPGHDPQVENVITAIEGVKQGLQEAGDAKSTVRGVALYAGWETDEQEWTDFMDTWVRRN